MDAQDNSPARIRLDPPEDVEPPTPPTPPPPRHSRYWALYDPQCPCEPCQTCGLTAGEAARAAATAAAAAPEERWAVIAGAPGYEVSTRGRVRNRKRGNQLSCRPERRGIPTFYGGDPPLIRPRRPPVVAIRRHELCPVTGRPKDPRGRVTHRVVHRLVALAFLANPEGLRLADIRHKNGNERDNRVENLGWGGAARAPGAGQN